MYDIVVNDDWLPNDMVSYLNDKFLYFTPHYYTQKSVESNTGEDDNGRFYYYEFLQKISTESGINTSYFEDSIIQYLCVKTINTMKKIGVKNVNFKRAYINVQHKDQHGGFHSDDGDITVLYMATKTPKSGSEFEIKAPNSKETTKIPFIQNRCVMFPAALEHRGLAPNTQSPRITFVFKTEVTF